MIILNIPLHDSNVTYFLLYRHIRSLSCWRCFPRSRSASSVSGGTYLHWLDQGYPLLCLVCHMASVIIWHRRPCTIGYMQGWGRSRGGGRRSTWPPQRKNWENSNCFKKVYIFLKNSYRALLDLEKANPLLFLTGVVRECWQERPLARLTALRLKKDLKQLVTKQFPYH